MVRTPLAFFLFLTSSNSLLAIYLKAAAIPSLSAGVRGLSRLVSDITLLEK